MLTLLLLLAGSDPVSLAPRAEPAPSMAFRSVVPDASIVPCGNDYLQRADVVGRQNPMFTPDGQVRRYLLLERRVDGCPQPISYDLPNQTQPLNQKPATGFHDAMQRGGSVSGVTRSSMVTSAPSGR